MRQEKFSDERREAFEERAAIIEEGCCVSREGSERMAAEQMAIMDDEIEFLQGAQIERP